MVNLDPTISEQVSKLCAGSGVARLDLTGSAVRDDFDPSTSDIDVAAGRVEVRTRRSSCPGLTDT